MVMDMADKMQLQSVNHSELEKFVDGNFILNFYITYTNLRI